MSKYAICSHNPLRGVFFVIILVLISHANAICTWPAVFASSTWLDSAQGQLVFTTTAVNGFSVTSGGSMVNSWTCQEESFDTDGIILIRTTAAINVLYKDWYIYICFKLTEIVNGVSYRYYRLHDQESNAGEQRVIIGIDAAQTSVNLCDTTNGASGSEFSTIIKQGSESSSFITCPSVLLGRFEFNYTNSGGTVSCNDPLNTEHMNVCSDKTQVAFDDPCTGQSIVYASDAVFCVASVTAGSDTFIQFYNNDTSVDDSTTYRFSCMAMSPDSTSATIVYNNCTNHQTSTYVPRSHDGAVIGASISFTTYVFCQGGCTWPSPFVSSTWQDNTRGEVIFGSDTLTQYSISVQGSTISQWECLDTSYFDSERILLIKSIDTFQFLGGTWTTYICLEMTKVSDYSYYYYQKHEQDVSGGYERGKFSQDGTLTGKSSICSNSYTVPAAEFHFMVKSGFEGDAKQFCSPSLLQRMDYTHTTAGGTVTCDTSTDNWDVCSDRTAMTFNYTTCNTQMAYSAAAEVYCMVNITSLYEYVVVYNADAARTKFACIVSNGAGTVASVVDNNCTTTQTPTSYAKAADGTDIGYLVTMSSIVTCPFTGPSIGDPDGGGTSMIPIIAGVVGGILVVAIAAGIIIYCLKSSKQGVSPSDIEKEKLPDDTSNGHVERINVDVVDTNPALTVHPERNTLTPLPPKPETMVTTPRVLPPIASHV